MPNDQLLVLLDRLLREVLAAAAPLIEAAVRAKVAAEIRAAAPGWATAGWAARIAEGGGD